MRAVSEGKLLASTKRDPAFISNGYTYWKEATSAFNFALIMCHSSTLAGSTELFYSDLYTVLKSQKCHQIQSQSINFSKFSWGGMPPDPPSIGMLRMQCVSHTILRFNDANSAWPIQNCFLHPCVCMYTYACRTWLEI